jgi:hypothetical protein
MVAVNRLSHEAGLAVFNVSAGGVDPKHFNNVLKLALQALNA